MTHEVERVTWQTLQGLLNQVDPQRTGYVIDAGVGHFDFYWEWAANMGFPALAVEPAPDERLVELCAEQAVPLFAGALSHTSDEAILYRADERDLRSLEGAVWGGMTAGETILTLTLPDLVARYTIGRITLLKLDVEGAEPRILSRLGDLPPDCLPQILCVEVGGEGPYASRRGPWSLLHLRAVRSMFQDLAFYGYREAVLIGAGGRLVIRSFTPAAPRFEATDNWGNVILVRDPLPAGSLLSLAQAGGVGWPV